VRLQARSDIPAGLRSQRRWRRGGWPAASVTARWRTARWRRRLAVSGRRRRRCPEASVVLVIGVGVGQELLLGRTEQHQGGREQRAVEHLVEAGASVVVGELLGLQVERDDYGVPIGAAVHPAQLVQGNGEQPAGELPHPSQW
jgi:hypothetical protein